MVTETGSLVKLRTTRKAVLCGPRRRRFRGRLQAPFQSVEDTLICLYRPSPSLSVVTPSMSPSAL